VVDIDCGIVGILCIMGVAVMGEPVLDKRVGVACIAGENVGVAWSDTEL